MARAAVTALVALGGCLFPAAGASSTSSASTQGAGLLSPAAGSSSASASSSSSQPFPYSVQLGNMAYVLYPNATGQIGFPDQSTIVLNFTESNLLLGLNAWRYTQVFINGTSLSDVLPGPVFPNITVDWDIEGALVDPENETIVHGFEHREHGWKNAEGQYLYNGYIEYRLSTDMARSFLPWPNATFPNSSAIILSASNPIGGDKNSGTGPHWSVVNGEYVYLYLQDNYAIDPVTNEPCVAYTVARSLLSDRGRPGTWWKYYNGSWNSPGLGGNATALANLTGAKIVWLSKAQMWLAVGYQGTLSYSADGIAWTLLPSSLFAQPPKGQSHSGYEFANWYYYTSLIPGWGGTVYYEGEDTLWLYFLFGTAGNTSWVSLPRGLAAVQLTLVPNNATTPSVPLPFVVVSLCQYFFRPSSSSNGGGEDGGGGDSLTTSPLRGPVSDRWATIAPVDQRVYDYGYFIGYVFASEEDWTASALQPVVDCFFLETHDHFVARPGECGPADSDSDSDSRVVGPLPSQYVASLAGSADPLTPAYLGALGFMLADNSTDVPGYQLLPIWRCYNATAQDHYLAPLYGCQPGDEFPTLLGYALWQND